MREAGIDISSASGRGNSIFTEHAESIFDTVFDLFGALDPEGRVIWMRGRIFERTNSNPDLLVGEPFSQTVFWQSSETTSKLLDKEIANAAAGNNGRRILDFRVSAEEKVPLELNFQLLTRENEKPYIFLCARTISEKPRLQEYKRESEQLLSAAENAEIGLWFWDFTEDKIYSTPQCNELIGLPAYEAITPQSFLDVVHPDDRGFVEGFLRRSQLEGTKYEDEFRVVYPDGTIEWICVEGKSFLNGAGEPQRMMGVVRKVTQQKIASEELSKVYDREKKARDEAVEANRAKDFFLAFVSHELRSPLNAILGWSKILLTKTVDDETRKNALETIERSARFQTKLINDLVDSARVASGKLRLEYHPTNLFEIVKGSYQAQKPAAEAHDLTFEFKADDENVAVFGDAGRLQQVFGNLISNAIKFTPDGGSILIEIKTGTDSVAVHVKDTGQGIDPESLPHIFQQFSQGDMTRKNSGGLGLGLSIVKILVGKHGGTVHAESEGLGKGAEFIVTLPLSTTAVPQEKIETYVPTAKNKPLSGIRILIVEDDHDSREVLQLFLEQCGAVVMAADSAKAAVSLLKASLPPAIIISDLAMPEEDGYSLIARIRAFPASAGGSVPAIALSAFTTVENKQRAFEVGFQKYCTKPFEPDLLVSDILEMVEKKS